MKKLLRLALISGVAAFGASNAYADPALVIRSEGCTVFDGTGAIVFVAGGDLQKTITQSANGNTNVKCKGNVTPSGSGAAHFDFGSTGVRCSIVTPFGVQVTENWKETVSASGQFQIECHAKS